ncbi:MAG: SpoIIE family protein phosphatase [Desulfobacterales bacterium]|nr:SpoIIE family protein phosphatase [Desulfobacterales bacterium]
MAVVIGDVSGHGVSSALMMASARAYLRAAAAKSDSAADTGDTGQFMTLFRNIREHEAFSVKKKFDRDVAKGSFFMIMSWTMVAKKDRRHFVEHNTRWMTTIKIFLLRPSFQNTRNERNHPCQNRREMTAANDRGE